MNHVRPHTRRDPNPFLSFRPSLNSLEERVVMDVGGLDGLDLTAATAIVTDASGVVIGDLAPDTQRAMASTTKIMTNLIALEATAPGNPDGLSLDDLVTVGWYPARVGGNTTNGSAAPETTTDPESPNNGARVGEVFRLRDLIDISMTRSDNELTQVIAEYLVSRTSMGQDFAAEAIDDFKLLKPSASYSQQQIIGQISFDLDSGVIINNAFTKWMNLRAAELGMHDTNFRSPHGRDPGNVPGISDYPESGPNAGHYSTAADLAILGRRAMQNPAFAAIVGTRDAFDVVSTLANGTANFRTNYVNGNQLVRESSSGYYPGATGVKTGGTGQAGSCLVSQATILGRTVNAVVLRSDDGQRFLESTRLLNYGFEQRYGFLVDAGERVIQTRTSTYDWDTRTLTVNGTDGNDTISVYRLATDLWISVNGVSEMLPLADFDSLLIVGGAGQDTILLSGRPANMPVAIDGGADSDGITLGAGAGLGAFSGAVAVTGGGGTADTLRIQDYGSSSGQSFAITSQAVSRGGTPLATYADIDRLIVSGTAQADTFRIVSTATRTATEVHGGNGADTLDYSSHSSSIFVDLAAGIASRLASFSSIENVTGGSGADTILGNAANNVLIGGAGNDILVGRTGNDTLGSSSGQNLLIGGDGSDLLTGGRGDDLLIGGSTAYDNNRSSLLAMMNAWADSSRSYSSRVSLLRSGHHYKGIVVRLDSTTVHDDGDADTLQGQGGLDWFWAVRGDLTDRDENRGEALN